MIEFIRIAVFIIVAIFFLAVVVEIFNHVGPDESNSNCRNNQEP